MRGGGRGRRPPSVDIGVLAVSAKEIKRMIISVPGIE
jgi:hypothetical protein